MAILLSVFILLFIVLSSCYNMADRWRIRADRQYPYVRELMEEWEFVTLRLLNTLGRELPEDRLSGQKHAWTAAAAANRLALACPVPDPANPVTAPLFARQQELAEELDVYLVVYNELVASYNKTLGRPVVRWMARLLKWPLWEELDLDPRAE